MVRKERYPGKIIRSRNKKNRITSSLSSSPSARRRTGIPAIFPFESRQFSGTVPSARSIPIGAWQFLPARGGPRFPASLDPFARQFQCGTGTGHRRDFQVDMPLVDRLDLDRGPEDRERRGNLDKCLEIVAGPDETLMRQDIDLKEEIAVLGPIIPGLAISFHPEPHTVVDTRRDMDRYLALYPGMAGTAACLTDFLRDFPASLALGTRGHPDKLAERGIHGLAHLAGPATPRAGVEPFCLAAGPAAGRARLRMHDFDLPVEPEHGILEADLDTHEEVRAGLGPRSSLASAAKEIEDIAKAGEVGVEPPGPAAPATGSTLLSTRW